MKKLHLAPTKSFEKSSKILIGILIILCSLVILGWLNRKIYLTIVGEKDFPMAPITAVLFILLGFYFLFSENFLTKNPKPVLANFILATVSLFSILILIFRTLNLNPEFENLYLDIIEIKNGANLGHMSFVTALFFIIFVFVLFLMGRANAVAKNLGVILVLFAFLCNFILIEGYAFDSPFFYKLGYIPPASVTVFCFLIVSIIIFINYDRTTFLLKDIYKTSSRAKLLRLFLPFTLFTIFIESVAIYRIIPLIHIHPAISISWLLILIFILILIAIPKMANLFGDSLDEAIEELQKSEEDFRAIFELNSSAIVILNEENIILRVNEAYCKITEYEESELIGESFLKLFDPSLHTDVLKDSTELTGDNTNFNVQLISKSGETKECLISKNSNKNGRYGIYSFIDITEKKKAENLLIISEQKLKETLHTKDKLISIVGHDLRNPMANILALSEILEDFHKNNEFDLALDYIKKVQTSASTTLKLLNNLLDWARLKNGQITFDPQLVLMDPILDELIEQHTFQAQHKNIQINTVSRKHYEVFADKKMLETILRNLLSNAIKFTPEGGKISISVNQDLNETSIRIQDNGVGMDSSKINELFNPTSFNSTLGTNKEKGTGLGLLLCKEFVENHNGKLSVESTPGHGSAFIFTLALKK
ncbi:MAG: hypothetical protein CFE21_08305 [Bacteroidetes bacterium B1(2017)]|nr:MAG: hypothetical protein CFE21_08305 [Bacteroidetes bacterium B1(2017)]